MQPIWITIGVVLLDQTSKLIIRWYFDLYEVLPVIPGFFNIRYIQNTGAAWGLFAGRQTGLILLSLVVLALLVVFRRAFFADTVPERVAYGILVGGIIGNLIDRLRLGYVVDFLDFYWGKWHFPAFNVADSAICVAVGIVLLLQFLHMRRQQVPVPGVDGQEAL